MSGAARGAASWAGDTICLGLLCKKNLLTHAPTRKTPCRVVVFGRSTCPFCIEVSRTMVEMGVPFIYYRLDQLTSGAEVRSAQRGNLIVVEDRPVCPQRACSS